jgi:GTPase Era involved in 16S rRNA processing
LLNALLAKRVAAVSKKRNTTRENLLAVACDSSSGVQISFYDTPGFVGHEVGKASGEKGRVERSVMTSGDPGRREIKRRNMLNYNYF